nr:hypothetical protein BgiMline_014621 [Biomphalaria glabrata]
MVMSLKSVCKDSLTLLGWNQWLGKMVLVLTPTLISVSLQLYYSSILDRSKRLCELWSPSPLTDGEIISAPMSPFRESYRLHNR